MNGWSNEQTWEAWTIISNSETYYLIIEEMYAMDCDDVVKLYVKNVLEREMTPAEVGCINFEELINNLEAHFFGGEEI